MNIVMKMEEFREYEEAMNVVISLENIHFPITRDETLVCAECWFPADGTEAWPCPTYKLIARLVD